MPNVLESLVDHRRLRFGDNLRVQELDANGATLRETDWESISGEKENEISFRFGINGVPTQWLVDKQGILRDLNARVDLERRVQRLLDKE